MSLEQPISVGDAYASFLLDEWKAAYAVRMVYRYNTISRVRDNDPLNDYISRLVCLYIELEPKVKGRTELKDYKDKFIELKPYINDPGKLSPIISQSNESGEIVEVTNDDRLKELEEVLRNIIEELNITKFEK